jgi:hypothetical protein
VILRLSLGQLGAEFLAFQLSDSRIPRGDQERRGCLKSFAVFWVFDQHVVGFDNRLPVKPLIMGIGSNGAEKSHKGFFAYPRKKVQSGISSRLENDPLPILSIVTTTCMSMRLK